MADGLIITGSPTDFCNFLDSRADSISGMLDGKLADLEQTAQCLAMAVINSMCSNGTSPNQPLHTSVNMLLTGISRCSEQLTGILFTDGQRVSPVDTITEPMQHACNSIIMQCLAQINTAAMHITSFMNILKGVADSVIKAVSLGPAGLICLIPLLEKVQNISWLIDLFSGFSGLIDINAIQELYGYAEVMLKRLLGFLLPELMNCSI